MAANRMKFTSFLCVLFGGVSASLAEPPSQADVIQALKKRGSFKALEIEIVEFVEGMSKRQKIPILFDVDAMPEGKFGPAVTCNLKDVPLGQALRSILKEHGLDYSVRDSVVLIVKEEEIEYRTWTDSSGRFTVKAELTSVTNGKVTLKRSDGRLVTLPASRLSAGDRKFLKSTVSDTKKVKASR